MTVSGRDVSYRRVDVDALDPEKFQDIEYIYDSAYGDSTGPNEQSVKQLLQSNKLPEALAESLKNIPLRSNDGGLKERSATLVLKVLTSFKTNEIESAVANLNPKQLAILLHYVLKAFEILTESQTSQQLCAWHAQIFNVGGHGILNQVFASHYRL